MDATQTLAFLAVGALLGAVGQLVRAAVGMKKASEKAHAEAAARAPEGGEAGGTEAPAPVWFDGRKLAVSVILGALAGTLASVTQYGVEAQLTRDLLLGFTAAGYAGADFIDGVMGAFRPKP